MLHKQILHTVYSQEKYNDLRAFTHILLMKFHEVEGMIIKENNIKQNIYQYICLIILE